MFKINNKTKNQTKLGLEPFHLKILIPSQQDHTFTYNPMFLKQPQHPSDLVGTLIQAAKQRLPFAQKLRRGQQKNRSMQVENGQRSTRQPPASFNIYSYTVDSRSRLMFFCELMF